MMRNHRNQRAVKAITINRVSTAEQAMDGKYSLPSQVRDNRAYCEKKGLQIIKELVFDESASREKRKRFDEATKMVEASDECIAIVSDRVDRFQRGWKESVKFDELRRAGRVELHFVQQGLMVHRNSSAYELMAWDAFVMFAKSYVDQLRENVKRGQRGKLEKGEYPSFCPTGYVNVKTTDEHGRICKEIHVDEKKAPFIKMIFEKYATGNYSLELLATEMRDLGFTMKSRGEDKPPTKGDIKNILSSPFYTGRFLWTNPDTGERQLYDNKGNYVPIITRPLYEKVQQVLAEGNTRYTGYKKSHFKFRGLLKCNFCGCTLTGEEFSRNYADKSNPNASTVYYRCSNGKSYVDADWYYHHYGTEHSGVRTARKGKQKGQKVINCPQRQWKEEEIEAYVLEQFEQIYYPPEVLEIIKRYLKWEHEKRIAEANRIIKGLKVKIGRHDQLIVSLLDKIAVCKNKALEEDLMNRYEEVKVEQESLKEQLLNYETGKEIDTDKTIDSMRLACDLKSHYLTLPADKQRELLHMVFHHIDACKGWWKLNAGAGRKITEHTKGTLTAVFNEPFLSLLSIRLEGLLSMDSDFVKDLDLTKEVRALLESQGKKNLTKKPISLTSTLE